MVILLFVRVQPVTAATHTIGRTVFLNTTPSLTQEGVHPEDNYYPGQAFSFSYWCSNTGNGINHNVVADSSDPWLTGTTSFSLGDMNPGDKQTRIFHGIVPWDAPRFETHAIVVECIVQSPFLYASSAYVIYVMMPPYTSPQEPYPYPPPATLEETPICESGQDPRCANGKGIICEPGFGAEVQYEDICAKYFQGAGYWLNPLYSFGGPMACVIATAAYGSPMAPEVVYMRTVRDGMIGSTPIGRVLRDAFNLWYYSWSTPVAEWIAGSESLRAVFRVLLIPVVLIVHVTAFIFSGLGGGDVGAVVSFFVAAILSIGTYILIPIMSLFRAFRWLGRRFIMKRSGRGLNIEP